MLCSQIKLYCNFKLLFWFPFAGGYEALAQRTWTQHSVYLHQKAQNSAYSISFVYYTIQPKYKNKGVWWVSRWFHYFLVFLSPLQKKLFNEDIFLEKVKLSELTWSPIVSPQTPLLSPVANRTICSHCFLKLFVLLILIFCLKTQWRNKAKLQ